MGLRLLTAFVSPSLTACPFEGSGNNATIKQRQSLPTKLLKDSKLPGDRQTHLWWRDFGLNVSKASKVLHQMELKWNPYWSMTALWWIKISAQVLKSEAKRLDEGIPGGDLIEITLAWWTPLWQGTCRLQFLLPVHADSELVYWGWHTKWQMLVPTCSTSLFYLACSRQPRGPPGWVTCHSISDKWPLI